MITPEALSGLGLFGVFVGAFLAGSIVAFPSEAAVVAAVAAGSAPLPIIVFVATAGNVAGAVTVFAIGRGASGLTGTRVARWLHRRVSPERLEQGRARLARFGSAALLLSWVPIVGDAVVLSAGLLRVRWLPFLGFVTVGKALRYAAVAWSAAAIARSL